MMDALVLQRPHLPPPYLGDVTIPSSLTVPQLGLPTFQIPGWALILGAIGAVFVIGAITRPVISKGVQKARTPRNISPTRVVLYVVGAGALGYGLARWTSSSQPLNVPQL